MKACTRCKEEKPLDDFAWNGRSGRRPVCRVCTYAAKAKTENVKVKPENKPLNAVQARREYDRRRRAIDALRAGKFTGDGPCWCCRSQAVGETPYRLCIICRG